MAQRKRVTTTKKKKAGSRGRSPSQHSTRSRSQQKRNGNGHAPGRHMVQNLEDGFLTELADMLNAEHQIIRMLPKMVHAAESQPLRQALQEHLEETEEQASRG